LSEFASGVAEKNRSRFYFLAERRKRSCGVCGCAKKYRATLFCCVKTLALRYVAFSYGMLENAHKLARPVGINNNSFYRAMLAQSAVMRQ